MFHLLNKNLNLQLFLLAILSGWAAWTVFARMTLMPTEGSMLLFQYIARLWEWSPLATRILVLSSVLLTVVGVIQHCNRHHFADNRTFMPGIFLLLLLNTGKFLHTLSPALLTNFFIALIMMIYSPGDQSAKIKDNLVTFGLTIAIATLLDISAFGIVLFLVLMVIVNNVSPLKDTVILIVSLAIPYLYAFSIAFMCNSLPAFLQSWRDLTVFIPVRQFLTMRIIDYVAMAYFLFITIVLIIRGKQLLDNKLIVIRQAFINLHLMMISMFLFVWLGFVPFPMATVYFVLPLSIYMTVAVLPKRHRFIIDFLIISLCILLWV